MAENEMSDEDVKQIMREIEEDLETYKSFNLPDDPGEARKSIDKVLSKFRTPLNPNDEAVIVWDKNTPIGAIHIPE